MQFSEYLESVKETLESMPINPRVDFFSGTLGEDDLNNLKLDGVKTYIYLGCRGGEFVQQSPKLEMDAAFGAYIITKERGHYNSTARDQAVEVAKIISKFRGNPANNTRLPVLQYLEELSSGGRNGTSYSVWALVWEQRIAI